MSREVQCLLGTVGSSEVDPVVFTVRPEVCDVRITINRNFLEVSFFWYPGKKLTQEKERETLLKPPCSILS